MSGNLGPILFLLLLPFVPLGVAAIFVAVVAAATNEADLRESKGIPRSYLVILLLSLLAIYWSFGITRWNIFFAIGIALFTILTGSFFLPRTRLRSFWPVIAIAATVMILMAIFPPVTEPLVPPGSAYAPPAIDPMPMYAYLLDSRLEAKNTYAQLVIDKSRLLLQWLTVSSLAAICCGIMMLRTKWGK